MSAPSLFSSETTVIRPPRGRAVQAGLRPLILGAVFEVTRLISETRHATEHGQGDLQWLLVAATAVSILAAVVSFVRSVLVMRVEIEPDRMRSYPRFGRSITVERSALARSLLVVRVGDRTSPRYLQSHLFLLDEDGRLLARFRRGLWDYEELARIATAWGTPFFHLDEPMTWADLRRRVPGAVPFSVAHPWARVGAIVGILVLAFVIVLCVSTVSILQG